MKKLSRIHSFNLNEQAEFLWRKFKKYTPRGYLSELISQVIIERFGTPELNQNFINEMVRLLEVKKLKIQEELSEQQDNWLKSLNK